MSTESSRERKVPPGPGQYDLPSFPNLHPCSHVPIPPKYSMFRKNKEPAARTDNVDPSKYAPKMDAFFDRAPTWGFGTAPRLLSKPNEKNSTPAANIKQVDNINFQRSPRYGFGSTQRQFVAESSCTPGPGGYNPNADKTSKHAAAPAFSSGGAVRMQQYKKTSALPGPGNYKEIDSLKNTWGLSPRTRFGKASNGRNKLAPLKNNTPGPGAYKISTMLRTGDHSIIESAPKWSMGGRGGFDLAKTTC